MNFSESPFQQTRWNPVVGVAECCGGSRKDAFKVGPLNLVGALCYHVSARALLVVVYVAEQDRHSFYGIAFCASSALKIPRPSRLLGAAVDPRAQKP